MRDAHAQGFRMEKTGKYFVFGPASHIEARQGAKEPRSQDAKVPRGRSIRSSSVTSSSSLILLSPVLPRISTSPF